MVHPAAMKGGKRIGRTVIPKRSFARRESEGGLSLADVVVVHRGGKRTLSYALQGFSCCYSRKKGIIWNN